MEKGRIKLDKDVVRALCSRDVKVYAEKELFTENPEEEKKLLNNLLHNEIPFCALVSGFRGTGKSSLVDYVFTDCEDDTIVVKFNLTKHDDYENLLRRIIRELYLNTKSHMDACKAVDKKEKSSSSYSLFNLELLYLSTFYSITEYGDYVSKNLKSHERSSELTTEFGKKIIANDVFVMITSLVALNDFWKKVAVAAAYVLGKMAQFTWSWKHSIKNSKSKSEERIAGAKVESLYDAEIAEYKLFDELKRLHQGGYKVVFVIDELDKMKSEDVKNIIYDVKPFLLNEHCNVVMVAGIDFEEQIEIDSKGMDGVGAGLFSYKIYVPITSLIDFETLSNVMIAEIDGKKVNYKSEGKDAVKVDFLGVSNPVNNYFKDKAVKARGIKRTFINSIIADAKSEDNELYIDYNQAQITDLKYFNALLKLEEELAEDYKDYQILQNNISIQYGLYYIMFKQNQIDENALKAEYSEHDKIERNADDDINAEDTIFYNGQMKCLDAFIPEEDKIYFTSKLPEKNRENIIRIIETSIRNYKEEWIIDVKLYDEVDRQFAEDLQKLLALFDERDNIKSNTDIRLISDLFKMVFYAAKYLDISYADFLRIAYGEFYSDANTYWDYDELDDLDVAYEILYPMLFVFDGSKGSKLSSYAEVLIYQWYLKTFKKDTFDGDLQPHGKGFDIEDKEAGVAFEIKAYNSVAYLNRYTGTIATQVNELLNRDTEKKIKKVAVPIFIEATPDKSRERHNRKINILRDTVFSKMVLINLFNYSTFCAAMQELEDFISGK